jgi:hypothetical protein
VIVATFVAIAVLVIETVVPIPAARARPLRTRGVSTTKAPSITPTAPAVNGVRSTYCSQLLESTGA